jgi:hypothetical protein
MNPLRCKAFNKKKLQRKIAEAFLFWCRGTERMRKNQGMKSNAFKNRGRTAKSSPLVDNFVLL